MALIPSLYVIGGAGAGKSTYTAEVIKTLGCTYGPPVDLHALHNRKALVTLRGHVLMRENDSEGLYLGIQRPLHPGSDGLDRASSPTAEDWLQHGNLPGFIISEGATLGTRRFLTALDELTNLLVVHLYVDDFIADLRFAERGTNQAPSFVAQTRTRSANLLAYMREAGAQTRSFDTGDRGEWETSLKEGVAHLQGMH